MNRKIWHRALLIQGLLLGCSGESSQGLESQDLTRIDDAGADGECTNGGVVISSGSDTNQNGKLDDDEVLGQPTVVCSGDTRADPDNPRLLSRADALPVGSPQCSAGGVAIHTGIDDDGDQLLADAEIDQTQLLCDHPVLTRAVSIPVGSPECVFGGKRIEAGADDGGGGAGVPDNAVLDEGEVDTSYLDCNTSPPVREEPIAPPAGPLGTATIDLRGGSSLDAVAGRGGSLGTELRGLTGCLPAISKIFTSGAVDASFVVPTLALDLGAVPYVVSTDTTLTFLPRLPVAGQFYYSTDGEIVRAGAPNAVVTGLRIEAGVTLTLPTARAVLRFTRDAEILGTLTLTAGARSLALDARQVVVGSAGIVDVAPSLTDASLLPTVTLRAFSQLVFRGALSGQGAAEGVSGADVTLSADGRVVLEGKIDVSGASSTTGVGSAGGILRAEGFGAGVWSAAQVDATGGDGPFGGGGGGQIALGLGLDRSLRSLDLKNSGLLDVSGGAQTGTNCVTGQCVGGAGGTLGVFATLADLASTGELRANGGSGAFGVGAGGDIAVAVLGNRSTTLPDARLSLSGAVQAVGGSASGSGAAGAQGGNFAFLNCTGSSSVTELLGYQAILAQGGSAQGSGDGGPGGSFNILTTVDVPSPRRLYANVPINLSGGAGFSGGSGGSLRAELSSIDSAVEADLPKGFPTLVWAGDHNIGGGNATPGSGAGGGAGQATLFTRGDLISSGSLTTSAGSGLTDGTASRGGAIELRSALGQVQNSAVLSANGGTTEASQNGSGGVGGCIALDGQSVSNSALLSARGGAGAIGGDGGAIGLISHLTLGTNTGMLDVAGGAGTPAGNIGLAGFDVPTFCID